MKLFVSVQKEIRMSTQIACRKIYNTEALYFVSHTLLD